MQEFVDWRQELCLFQRYLDHSLGDSQLVNLLKQPITEVLTPRLVSIHSDTSVYDAIVLLLESEVDFALIQDTPDTILGVIRIEALDKALIENSENRELRVATYMDRNVCIEPECATCLEVMNRITIGHCPCTVLIDQRGTPAGIITPRLLIESLAEELPPESWTRSPLRHLT